MHRETLLTAFAEMSPEDQEAILTERTTQEGAEEAKTACSLAATHEGDEGKDAGGWRPDGMVRGDAARERL